MSLEPTRILPVGKFIGLGIDVPGLGRMQLTHILKQTTETAIYRLNHPGIIVKAFDLSSPVPGELSYGPYLRLGLELENFEDIMNLDDLRGFVPVYYGASVNQEKQYGYIIMEYLQGQDLLAWCEEGAVGGYPEHWVHEFKQAIYETLSIMTVFHKHKIVLVDFKPDNVIRLAQSGVKFVDLGAFFTPRHHLATEKYLYSATPDYAELLIDSSNIETGLPPTEASDIFSAGVALFEMATGTSRLAIGDETADEILGHPEIYKFRDSQTRDLLHSYPHLEGILPSVEEQLKERRILFSELWHIFKGYLALKVPEWEQLESEQRDQIILTTGTTFIMEQLPSALQWLAGPIAHSTVLRSIRLKTVAQLMKLIEDPIPEQTKADLEGRNRFVNYLKGLQFSTDFLHRLNTWEVKENEHSSHWTIGAPTAWAEFSDSAQFMFLKRVDTDPWGHKYLLAVDDFEADDLGDRKLTLWEVRDDHFAWLC